MSSEPEIQESPRRKALQVAASALCSEVGYSHADEAVLETLTEMLQSYICELGRSTQAFAELSCRTAPMVSDVVMALVEMGADVQSLPAYSNRPNKMIFMPPAPSLPVPNPRTLQAGDIKQHPSYIPHYLPPFPDPHTYIRTETIKKPVTDYQSIREKAASQKRDVERALTRFIAKTGNTENLFPDDPYAFPLIACNPKPLPYLDALLPKEHELDAQEDQDEPTAKRLRQQRAQQDNQMSKTETEPVAEVTPEVPAHPLQQQQANQQQGPQPPTPKAGDNVESNDNDNQIDNPYLRAIKMPKFKIGKKCKY